MGPLCPELLDGLFQSGVPIVKVSYLFAVFNLHLLKALDLVRDLPPFFVESLLPLPSSQEITLWILVVIGVIVRFARVCSAHIHAVS